MMIRIPTVRIPLLVGLLFFLVSCTGQLTGLIYGDRNGNGLMDLDEPAISNVKVTITKDGKVLTSGYPNPDGSFATKMDDKGLYCVIVEDDYSYYGTASGDAVVHPSTMGIGAGMAKQAGTPTEDSSDSSDDDETESPGAVGSPNSSGESRPRQSASSSGATGETGRVGEHCQEGSFSGTIHFEIPRAWDPMMEVNAMPELQPVKLKPGESKVVTILYPCEGQLLPLYLPDWLECAAGVGGHTASRFDPSLGMMEFRPLPEAVVNPSLSTMTTTGRPEICAANLVCRAHDGLADDEALSGEVIPRVRISTGTQDLRKISFEYDASINGGDLKIEMKIVGSPRLGGELALDISVKNPDKISMEDVVLAITYPNTLQLVSLNRTDVCDSVSNPLMCEFAFEDGERRQRFYMQFLLPGHDELYGTTEFKISADVDAEAMEESVTEEVSFSLTPPPPPPADE